MDYASRLIPGEDKKSSITTDTYTMTLTTSRNGRQVYCKITDAYGNKADSDIVTLTRLTPLTLTLDKTQTAAAPGADFTLYGDGREGNEKGASISYPDLYRDLRPGSKILIDDGLIELEVEKPEKDGIRCQVINGGSISDRKSINVPGVALSIPFMSDKDRADLKFGVEQDFDFIAASFTQTPENIAEMTENLLTALSRRTGKA